MTNGAELLVESLVRHGVDTVFGFPGDTSIALYEELGRRTADVRHVLARDERHAGFMADAYSRTTRRLGVCEAASGAGAVYLASGLAEALTSSIPLLAIATDNSTRSAGTAPISEMDLDALFAACTKWRRTATSPDELPLLVAAAVRAATEGRPGPAAVIIPEDVLETTTAAATTAPTGDRAAPVTIPWSRPPAPDDAVARAAALLASAERPAVLAGGGVHLSGAWAELAALAERAATPVGTSIHGKGALDEAHPLSLGVVGANGARDYANDWLAGSDCVLMVGTRANATDTLSFSVPARGGADVLHIDTDATRAGRNYPGSVPLVGDARTVLAQLTAALPATRPDVAAELAVRLAEARSAWAQQVEGGTPVLPDGVLHPREVVRVLAEAFGRDTWVTADAGTPTPYLASFWEAPGDGWRVVIPRGHGPMGFAIPASIGVAVAHPGARVLCLTTENSVAMAVAEWETARRLGLPVTYVVLDNRSLAWIKMIQHLYAGGRYFAVDPGAIDPVRLGAGMGVPGTRADTVDELAALAKRAADDTGPSVIHVLVPEHMDIPPPVATWQAALTGRQTTRPVH